MGQNKNNRVEEQPRKKQRLQNTAEYLERSRGEVVAKKSVARQAKAATATNQRRTDRKDVPTQKTHTSAEKSREYFHMPFFESRHEKIDDGRDLRVVAFEDFEEFFETPDKEPYSWLWYLDLRRQMKHFEYINLEKLKKNKERLKKIHLLNGSLSVSCKGIRLLGRLRMEKSFVY